MEADQPSTQGQEYQLVSGNAKISDASPGRRAQISRADQAPGARALPARQLQVESDHNAERRVLGLLQPYHRLVRLDTKNRPHYDEQG